jgi:integration host factor subunit beta
LVKSELVQRLVARNPHLYQRDVENIVDAILREIADALARYDRVELRGFGVFSTKQRRARTGRNPRTGDNVLVIEKHVPLGRARNCANCSIDVEIRPAQRDGRIGRPHFGDVRGVSHGLDPQPTFAPATKMDGIGRWRNGRFRAEGRENDSR